MVPRKLPLLLAVSFPSPLAPPPPPPSPLHVAARSLSATTCADAQGATNCGTWARVGGCGKATFRARCCATCDAWCARPGTACAPSVASTGLVIAAATPTAAAGSTTFAAAASSVSRSAATISATCDRTFLDDGSYNRACCGQRRTDCDDCHCGRQACCDSAAKEATDAAKPNAAGTRGGSWEEGGAKAGACPDSRKPYHVVLTAASGVYQEWQTRIAYRQYLTLKEAEPCSDLGGFTRLLNTPDAQPDGLMDEIPTVLVKQLKGGVCDECDHHFVVMNRPWGLRQFLEHPAYARIPESYLFIVETDHLLMRPPPNRATESTPVGFGFYYMTYKYDPPKLRPVVAKYHDPDAVDPVGPSPVIIHKEQLRTVVEPYWQLCLTLKRDKEANQAFGWVLEMWAWSLATARLGIRHLVVKELQAEPANQGIHDLARYFVYHYTFDLKAGPWAWSKRSYTWKYPPRALPTPPRSAAPSSHTYIEVMNRAIAVLPDWGSRNPGKHAPKI